MRERAPLRGSLRSRATIQTISVAHRFAAPCDRALQFKLSQSLTASRLPAIARYNSNYLSRSPLRGSLRVALL
ncbi:hypothetical protein [Lusitaniella coriacea]|uniref:hypothetical protein n=1 Tax=Lusitaniella coriacea TaxID=1983105 RepID=UPI003CF52AA5